MNQGKLGVVKQEMARVTVDILGISKLKWTGMGEFNSDDHYIYYYGQEFLRRNGVAIMVNKRVRYAVWMQSQKRQNLLIWNHKYRGLTMGLEYPWNLVSKIRPGTNPQETTRDDYTYNYKCKGREVHMLSLHIC